MLNIQHNLLAQNANRQLGINTKKNTKITEKLSSGYKINRAADDAAGLAISEKMRRQVRGLNQGANNIKDGIGYVQTAEGALNEVHDMLQRINELAVEAANGTNTVADRAYINSEVQALKKEMNRIFETTSFNEQRIWQVEKSREILGYQHVEGVVKFNSSSTSFDITDENCGVIAQGGYNMKANEDGITVSWKGYNGKSYATNTISWEELRRNNYRFEISDYFKATDTDLISPTTGEKLIKHRVSMDVNDSVEFDDIKNALIDTINGSYYTTLSQYVSSPISARLENPNGNEISKNWLNTGTQVYFSASLNYATAYKSHINSADGYDFDTARDVFIEPTINDTTNLQYPSATDVDSAKASNEKWTFTFYMQGIGVVTAESRSVIYSSSDRDDASLDHWWHWVYPTHGTPYKTANSYPTPNNTTGTLGDVMAALTGTDGLLDASKGGNTYSGGTISLSFTLSTRNSDGTTSVIGSLSTGIPVKAGSAGDDEAAVLERVRDVFNENTILDIYTSDNNVQWGYAGEIYNWETEWMGDGDIPIYGNNFVYGGVHNFFVQAGAEAGQHISIEYDALSNIIIGIEDTNVLTQESAGNAIDEVKGALQKISEQRSDFGAYQNRLEHAYNINNNTSENTQSAESVVRDADIANMMVEYSINNILMQAGTSMLAQANQSSQTAVQLLQ